MEKRSIMELRRPYLSGPRTSAILSILVMGAGQLYNRQYGKGIMLLLLHFVGLYGAIAKLPHAVWALVTLGETKTRLEKVGKLYQQVMGDHSIYLLVEGLVMIFLMFILLAVYVQNIRDAYRCARLRDEGVPLHTFRQTLHFLIDYRFPQMIIAIPVLGVVFFTVMPIVFMILLAFTDFTRNHMPPAQLINWHGLETFRDIFRLRVWSQTLYGVTLWTLVWALASTTTCFAAGFAIALTVQQKDIRFRKFWRTMFILPYAIPLFISTLILRNVFNGQFGPVNDYLSLMGFGRIPWLSDPEWAKFTLVIVNMLLGFPVIMLMIIGVLSTIPGDMYEAADIDGADGFQKLRLITFPTVMYTMMPILIMQFVGNINNFNVIYLLTGGNPVNGNYQFAGHTDILITWLYKLSMEQGQYNFASVIGVFIFVLLSGFAIWSIRRTQSFKEERQ